MEITVTKRGNKRYGMINPSVTNLGDDYLLRFYFLFEDGKRLTADFRQTKDNPASVLYMEFEGTRCHVGGLIDYPNDPTATPYLLDEVQFWSHAEDAVVEGDDMKEDPQPLIPVQHPSIGGRSPMSPVEAP